jgi:hypothetical protein
LGIRRRRKKINTILTTIDRRLRSVELQRVPRVVKDGTITRKMLEKAIQIDLATSTDAATETPGTSTPKPPNFKDRPLTNIVQVRYRGYNEAGTANDKDEATIVFETDPGLNVGDKLRFAATISALDVPSKTSEYTVESIGTTTISGQTYSTAVYRPGRATIVSGTITYNKGWRIREENVSLPVDSFDGDIDKYKYWQITVYGKGTSPSTDSDYLYGPTWPAGLPTTSGIHMTGGTFDAGTLINIVGLGDPFDGTFKIINKTTVGTAITLKMEFKEYLASVTLPTTDGAIRAAAGRYLRDGETWIDTTVTPAVVWVWDEEKQVWINSSELPEGTVIDDGIPPSPPTNLSGTTEGYLSPDNKPFSRVSLTWTAPTTNSDSTNLSDLKGYKVYYRYSTNEGYTFYSDVTTTSATVQGLVAETAAYFAVKAYDVSNNLSAFSQSFTINTVAGAITLAAPSTPVFTSKLGTVKVVWNGLDANGQTPPVGYVSYIEVHWSTTTGFTPSESTLKGRLSGKSDYYSDIDPAYDTNYYFKFIFVDAFGVKSAPSAQRLVTVQALVNTDLIAGSLTRWPFGANTIDVASLADGSIAATYLVSGTDAGGNAVRTEGKIAAGSIGAVAIAANSIVAGKIAANAVTANTIAALSIEAGKIAANAITADKIAAGAITAEKISAGAITGETITGGTITGAKLRTAATGERVEIGVSAFGTVSFFNSGGSQIGSIYAFSFDDGGGVNNWINIDSAYTRIAGYTSIGGRLNVSGRLNTASGLEASAVYTGSSSTFFEVLEGPLRVANQYLQVPDTRSRSTTGGLAVFVASNGTYHVGSSSIRFKQNVVPYSIDFNALLSLNPVSFRYKQEVDELGDSAGTTVGFIAEDLVEKGLSEYVVFEKDEDGVDQPFGINYQNMVVGLQDALKNIDIRLKALEEK